MASGCAPAFLLRLMGAGPLMAVCLFAPTAFAQADREAAADAATAEDATAAASLFRDAV